MIACYSPALVLSALVGHFNRKATLLSAHAAARSPDPQRTTSPNLIFITKWESGKICISKAKQAEETFNLD